MVDYEEAQNPSLFCGTGGCRRQIYVSRDGGYVLAFDRVIRLFKIRKAKGRRLLDLDFHGSTCGGAGVEECPRGYVWNETLGRFIERPNVKGGPGKDSPPVPTVILISKGGDFVVGFEAPEANWGIDLAPTPTFKTVEGADDCAFREEKPCDRLAWRWNGEKLVRAP
jgi:hypothetical protein